MDSVEEKQMGGASHVPPVPNPADVENQNKTPPEASAAGFTISGILRRWKREDLMKRGSLAVRGLAIVFSFLSFVIMASNKHGGWLNFDNYEEYKYLLAIAIISTLYTGVQVLRHVHEMWTGKELLSRRNSALVDFIGDQVMAYLLISSASAAGPLTNKFRESQDNIFTDSSAAAISMSFFAFFCLAISALISGYKLPKSYI